MSPETPRKSAAKNLGRGAAEIKTPAPPGKVRPLKRISQHGKAKNKGGRPLKITDEEVRKLEAAFCNDFTIDEALDYAKVSRSTYYARMKSDTGFLDRMRRSQSYALTVAKKSMMAQIKGTGEEPGDGNLALRFLERRQPERYRTKIESDVPITPGGVTVIFGHGAPHPRFVPPSKDAKRNKKS